MTYLELTMEGTKVLIRVKDILSVWASPYGTYIQAYNQVHKVTESYEQVKELLRRENKKVIAIDQEEPEPSS